MGKSRKSFMIVAAVLAACLVVAAIIVGPRLLKFLPRPTLSSVSDVARIDEFGNGRFKHLALVPGISNGRLVVYAHGSSQDERAIVTEATDASLAIALVQDGYTVVSSSAGGNAWGSTASVEDYRNIIKYSRAVYRVQDVYLLAESMGGLPSLQLLGDPGIKAWAGIYPVCNASTVVSNVDIKAQMDKAYPDAPTYLQDLSPVAIRTGKPMIFWASHDDATVPAATNTEACAADARRAGASVTVIPTTGNHGDGSNFEPTRLVEFFNSH
jgi:fermentation-respiration switch protein FrsA (DUF1100 family)